MRNLSLALWLYLFFFQFEARAAFPWRNYYAGKTAIVTGGSSGIGSSIARQLAASGANVILMARNREGLHSELSHLENARSDPHQRFAWYAVDVSDPGEVQAAAGAVLADFESIDFLFNVAGFCHPQYLENIPPDRITSMISTNLLGPMYLVRAFKPHFLRRNQGHIIVVGSMAAYFNFTGMTVYSASKAGLLAFSRSLRNELIGTGVSATVLQPSDTDTRGLREENYWKPEITAHISGAAKLMSPDAVAQALLLGVSRKQFEVVPGRENQILAFIGRHFPGCIQAILDFKARQYRRTAQHIKSDVPKQ